MLHFKFVWVPHCCSFLVIIVGGDVSVWSGVVPLCRGVLSCIFLVLSAGMFVCICIFGL